MCPHCGDLPVNHSKEYWPLVIDSFLTPLHGFLDIIWQKCGAPIKLLCADKHMVTLLRFLTRCGVASRQKATEPQEEIMFQCMWEEAEKRGIRIEEFVLFHQRRGICVAYYKEKMYCFDRLPRPPGISQSLYWMDNKAILKKKLSAQGIPVARGEAVFSLPSLIKVFHHLTKPVVTKPHIGSGCCHVTMHIMTEEEAISAFTIAKELSPFVVIEEQLVGPVYRVTGIGGKIIGVMRRDQPSVVGDGYSSVQQLIEKENQHPKRKSCGPLFYTITIDEKTHAELKRQHMTIADIPQKGKVVTLHPKINRSFGGTTTDVTDLVHPDNLALFEKIILCMGDPLIGIDFIIADISQSWIYQPHCGVIECNSLPFIGGHHLPFDGQPRNAAGALWDLIFP